MVSLYHATMSGCTLRFARNSPLRTTLVDEATGHVKYKIDTPMRITRSVTRIRKFDSSTQPPLLWDEDADPDPGDDISDKGKNKEKSDSRKCKRDNEERDETETELPETGDEIARVYWNWFSPDRIIFQGRITNRHEFLPATGKMNM